MAVALQVKTGGNGAHTWIDKDTLCAQIVTAKQRSLLFAPSLGDQLAHRDDID